MIVGVGEVNDRPAVAVDGLDPAGLMAAALAAADADAGGGWLARCERLSIVPQIGFPGFDVPAALARATGIAHDRIEETGLASGDTPIRLLDEAAAAIRAGTIEVAAITGGEALRTAAARAKAAGGGAGLFAGSAQSAAPLRRRYGLIGPSDIYPLYENALRAELGQTLAEAQVETGRIWSLMSEVATHADGAWLHTPRTPDEIATPDADNRPIAFPYTKLMVANASVNQGAAMIVTSLAAARAAGIAEDRIVHVGAGAGAHESEDPLARAGWTTSPSMRASIERALALNAIGVDTIDLVELYSCFPCVPKMARRLLGWPLDRPITVHGGLTFGGGPIGNYMGHAVAAMVRRIRGGARNGFLFANGGHCSHNHSLLLTREAPVTPLPAPGDTQAEADAQRGPIPPLTDAIEGALPVETYTVVYDRTGAPAYGVVLSRAPTGERVVARVLPDDAVSIAWLTDGAVEPVGRMGINRREGDLLVWRAA
ncbi:acetyl-CoA acetyltransferase [Sphingomonas solaris]|uniref:acetyl-CoA acetyltransferase n=1 Tax=Alterirhizorhabdus solaris TaxID=2529389 RepID=UPI001EF0BB05|nr:acetyl-CoA acetyltransferase [Sphingomonas solaris]